MKIKIISMICLIAMVFSLASMGIVSASAESPLDANKWEERNGITDQDFSFVFVGDTQYVCHGDYTDGTENMNIIYDWIVDNVETRKIAHVFGLGDVTDRSCGNRQDLSAGYGRPGFASGTGEWEIAKEAITKLNGVVPYTMVRGNHDDYQFDDFFNYEEYTSQLDGFYTEAEYPDYANGTLTNAYKLFEVQRIKFLIMTLDFNPTKGAIEWANEVVAAHPDYNVIVTMHSYVDGDGTLVNFVKDSGSYGKWNGYTAREIERDFIKKHSNIIMVASGHVGAPDGDIILQSVRPGENGNDVIELMVNGQFIDSQQKVGMVGIVSFYNEGDQLKIRTEYYSTILGKYKKGNDYTRLINNIQLPPPETTTEATTVATEAETTTVVEDTDKKGCGSSVSLISIALLPAFATFSVASIRKKKEND